MHASWRSRKRWRFNGDDGDGYYTRHQRWVFKNEPRSDGIPSALAFIHNIEKHPLWEDYVSCAHYIRSMRIVDYKYQRPPRGDPTDVEAAFDSMAQSAPSATPGGLRALIAEAKDKWDHMRKAHALLHPYSDGTPNLPPDLNAACNEVCKRGVSIVAWRAARMAVLDEMRDRLAPLSAHIVDGMKPMEAYGPRSMRRHASSHVGRHDRWG